MNHEQAVNRQLAGAVKDRGYDSNAPDNLAADGGHPGHPIYPFLGYGVNPARAIGADLEPIPITPVKWQNWPEMQIQLLNGWMLTNWGKKISYDDYLKQLASSEDKGRAYLTPNKGANVNIGPSPLNVAAWAQSSAGAQPNNPAAPGQVVGAITNGGYYG